MEDKDKEEIQGFKTKLTGVDPETGKMSWDVSYDVEPEVLYNKLSDLVDFMKDVPKGSELGKIAKALKLLKNQTIEVKNIDQHFGQEHMQF
jgi:hypothetical protein